MTWTYDSSDISTDLAKVRTEIGDTNSSDQGLSDEQIQYFIDMSPSALSGATFRAARALYAKWVRDVDRSNIGMSVQRSQKLQHLMDLMKELKASRIAMAAPKIGGVSQSSKDSLTDDGDLVSPAIQRRQFDNS